jgi:hypothetical protein
MARIYTSRQLLDPRMIQMANQATENRIAQEAARRQNILNAWQNVGTTAGSSLDKYIAAKRAEEEQNKRYNELLWNSSEDDRRDPAYLAAINEYARTGSASPLSNLILQRQAAEARKQSAADAIAERKSKEDAYRRAEINAAQETYAKLQKDMLDALDAGKTQDAEIKRKALEALEKKYADENGVSPFGDTADSIKRAREEEILNRKNAEEKENNRLLGVANFLAGLPTTYKNDDDKKPIIEAINKNETLNAKEKADAINKILGIESGKTATKKAVQSAVAGKAGEKAGKAIEESDNKNKAKSFAGKKMNILQWNKIPEEVRQHLKIDGNGNVTEK